MGQVWRRLGSNFVLLDQIRELMDCSTTVKRIVEVSGKWRGATAKLIEDKANGSAVIQMLTNQISGIIPVNPSGGKIGRAAAISPLMEAGNIYIAHPQMFPWVNGFLEECAAFPNGAHGDPVDAMTQALLRWHMAPQDQTFVYLCDPISTSPIGTLRTGAPPEHAQWMLPRAHLFGGCLPRRFTSG